MVKRTFIMIAWLLMLGGGQVLSAPVSWELINEYPATSMPGEADSVFADLVKRKTGGQVTIILRPDGQSGMRTGEQLKAVTNGKFAMADSLAGALGEESPVFLLSSLPFLTSSPAQARALFDAARPLYEKVFAERKQKLLYVSPWPPAGIWSSTAITNADALKTLRIRTYDDTGTDLMAQVTVAANQLSLTALSTKLESGEINAVLSSGDGDLGPLYWRHLRHFSNIVYSVPLSFGTVSLDAWNALDEKTRAFIEEAGRETTERQWATLQNRVAHNFARMRENGVVIDENPPAEVMRALYAASAKAVMEWETWAGPDAGQVLQKYIVSKPR